MENTELNKAKEAISLAEKIIITTHKSPDGDAMGSSLALYKWLKTMNKNVTVIVPNTIAEFLLWLPGTEDVVVYENETEKSKNLIESADLIFCLDYGQLNRTGEVADALAKNTNTKIVIDHHQNPSDEFEIYFSNTLASSTAEMVYLFIDEIDIDIAFDSEMGECVFTGIVTDTGSFKFSCTSETTFNIAAEIKRLGVDTTEIFNRIYDTNSYERLQLLGYAISEKLEYLKEWSTVIIWLTKEELAKYNTRPGYTEGIVNFGLSIAGVKMAVFLSEKDGLTKMSFRSKGDFKVNEIAGKYFNGGGHFNAAGGATEEPIETVVEKIKSILPEYADALR